KELPVPLDHRALKLVAVADALAPSVDQLLAAEGKPLEETHDDLRQRRAQLLASRDAVELLLASRNRQVAELALDPRELERLAEVGRLVLERDANQRAAQIVPRLVDRGPRGQLVVVEEQVQVGVEVSVAATGRAGEQDCQRPCALLVHAQDAVCGSAEL